MRILLATFLLVSVGCTHYEFDLVQPSNVATHIGTKADSVVALEPLEYRFRAYEDHLIVRAFNPTEDPIELLGAQSSVVDPNGQSHPLRGATIEPHSFIQLVLPPVPGVYVQPGPNIGISIGGGYGYHHGHGHRHYGYYGWYRYPYYYYCEPRYLVVYDSGDQYWDWRGDNTAVRMALSYVRNGKNFRDEFEIGRVKVKN